MISFDVFSQVELRIGKIKEVDVHPNADKLYVLKVDLGEKEVGIVAGLRPYYQPEELLGKLVVVVANLEPRVVRGVESQGMILAAGGKETTAILMPEKEVEIGSSVK